VRFSARDVDYCRAVCLVLVGLKLAHPRPLHISPPNLTPDLKARAVNKYVEAIENLAARHLIAYSLFIPSTNTFMDVSLTTEGLALLAHISAVDGHTLSERLDAALSSPDIALERVVVDELLAESTRGSSQVRDR
jgi:hypothetical protein